MSQYRSCLVNFEMGLDYKKKKKIGGCLFWRCGAVSSGGRLFVNTLTLLPFWLPVWRIGPWSWDPSMNGGSRSWRWEERSSYENPTRWWNPWRWPARPKCGTPGRRKKTSREEKNSLQKDLRSVFSPYEIISCRCDGSSRMNGTTIELFFIFKSKTKYFL